MGWSHDAWYNYQTHVEPKWAGSIGKLVGGWRFRRGLVECVRLKVSCFLERADELFRLAPVRHVEFQENELGPGAMAALASNPNMARLTEIGFDHTPVGDAGLQLLLDSPHVGRLTLLRLHSCGITEVGARPLAASPKLSSLSILDLGDSTIAYWRDHPNSIGLDFARALATSPHLASLTSLRLDCEPGHMIGHAIGDAGSSALAASANLEHVTELDLSCNEIGDEGILSLAGSPHLGRLVSLDLRCNRITASGMQALIDSPRLTGLTTIGLSDNPGSYRIEYCYDQGAHVWSNEDREGRERLTKRFHRKVQLH